MCEREREIKGESGDDCKSPVGGNRCEFASKGASL